MNRITKAERERIVSYAQGLDITDPMRGKYDGMSYKDAIEAVQERFGISRGRAKGAVTLALRIARKR